MRVPIEWLKEFVEIKLKKKALAEKLTLVGLGVEEIEDDILVLEITPNRGDCLSILGIAREVAAITNSKFKIQNSKLEVKSQNLNKKINIEISEPKICPRYTFRIIDGIKISPSPEWLKERLLAYGFRPKNNVVDVTNYVMIELGQPLHAFDYEKIEGQKMIIRRGKKGESVVTLDGVKREVDEESIVIQDSQKLIDLAGIMGGQNSEVSEKTRTIILQAAIFDPVLIRRTSKKIGLSSEASYRYERGVDWQGTVSALERATSFILKTSGRAGEIVDLENVKWQPIEIKWKPEKDVEKILGIKLKRREILRLLDKLAIKCLWCSKDGKTCQMEIPSFRHDLKIPEDLVEEVGRMYGYWRLPKTILPKKKEIRRNKEWINEQKIKDFLVNLGFTEVESYPYLSGQDLENAGLKLKECLEIKNPLSPETQFLRPNLLPSILKQVAKNPWAREVKIFEIGRVWENNREKKQIAIASTNPQEKLNLKEVEGEILNKFKIRRKVYGKIIDLNRFLAPIRLPKEFKTDFPKRKVRPISPFPPVVFDLAIVVDKKIKSEEIEKTIQKSSPLVFLLELFDEYTGPQLPKGKKSLAYHLTLSSPNQTLKDEEIKKVRQKIISDLKEKLKAQIRGMEI